jgi:hypothetical protein
MTRKELMKMRNRSIYFQAAFFIALLLTTSNLSPLGAHTPKADQTTTLTIFTTETSTETITTFETTTATETSTRLYATTMTSEAESTTTDRWLTWQTVSRTLTESVTTWPKHGPDSQFDETLLINQFSPGIVNGDKACCATTFAMILKWMEKKYGFVIPSRPDSDVGLVNLFRSSQYLDTDGGGPTTRQIDAGFRSFLGSFRGGSLPAEYIFHRWSYKDYKQALDKGRAVALILRYAGTATTNATGHCVWGIAAGGLPPPDLSLPEDWASMPSSLYAPITIADPWGGRIVHALVLGKSGDFRDENPSMRKGFADGVIVGFFTLAPKALFSEFFAVDPVQGYVVVASDGNYYIINATNYADVRVTNGEVSGISDGNLLRASGAVYGLTNGTVFVPPGVSLSAVNKVNFPSLSLSIVNGSQLIADSPDMQYYPSLTATPLSPEANASLTADTVKLTAKVTVNGTGEGSSPVAYATVRFFINYREIGSANTDSAGLATFEYTPKSSGEYSWYVRASSGSYPEEISWPPRQFSVTPPAPNVPYLPYLGLIIIVIAGAVFAVSRSKKRRLVTAYPAPQPQPEMEFCIFCGQRIPVNSEYCSDCGKPQRDL